MSCCSGSVVGVVCGFFLGGGGGGGGGGTQHEKFDVICVGVNSCLGG